MKSKRPSSSTSKPSVKRSKTTHSPLCVAVLLFHLRHTSPFPLSPNIIREISSYSPPLILACAYQSHLYVYNLPQNHLRKVELPRGIAPFSQFIHIDLVRVLTLPGFESGWKPHTALYLLRLNVLRKDPFPGFSVPRTAPHLVVMRGVVYVFGGGSGQIGRKHCEKASVKHRCWTQLPDLPDGIMFDFAISPVCISLLIYLPYRYQESLVFDTVTETFKTLKLTTRLFGTCLSFSLSEELCLLHHSGMLLRYHVGSDSLTHRQLPVTLHRHSTYAQVYGRSVYWLDVMSAHIWTLDLDSYIVTSKSIG